MYQFKRELVLGYLFEETAAVRNAFPCTNTPWVKPLILVSLSAGHLLGSHCTLCTDPAGTPSTREEMEGEAGGPCPGGPQRPGA